MTSSASLSLEIVLEKWKSGFHCLSWPRNRVLPIFLDVRAKPDCQIWLIFGNILSIFERRGESQGLNYTGLFQSPPPARRAPPFLSEVPCVRTCMFYGHQLYSDNFMFYVRLDRPTSDLCCVWGGVTQPGIRWSRLHECSMSFCVINISLARSKIQSSSLDDGSSAIAAWFAFCRTLKVATDESPDIRTVL